MSTSRFSPPGEQPKVVCVVLNWNGWQDTIPCVLSLQALAYRSLEILVVDNGSTDDSVAEIRRALPEVELLEAKANKGFSAGCNHGIRRALADNASFVWLLNNDTVVPPDTLQKLLQCAGKVDRATNETSQPGIVGSVLYYFDEPTRIQAWGGSTMDLRSGYNRQFDAPVELSKGGFVTFASVLLRRNMLLEVGLLDEGFFMYYEDADLCFRARSAGWTLAVASDTAILHKVGSSRKKKRRASTDRMVTASGLRFLARHGRPPILARVLFLLMRFGRRVREWDRPGVMAVWHGYQDWSEQGSQEVLCGSTPTDAARPTHV